MLVRRAHRCTGILQQTLLIHMHGAIISSLHRVAIASVNSYTFNIVQVNVFIKVIVRRQRSMVLFCSRSNMIWASSFCLKTIILSIQVHVYKRICVTLIRFQVVIYNKNLIINSNNCIWF